MNEAETRAELVDPALKAAGWGGVRKPDSARVHHFRAFATRKHPRQFSITAGGSSAASRSITGSCVTSPLKTHGSRGFSTCWRWWKNRPAGPPGRFGTFGNCGSRPRRCCKPGGPSCIRQNCWRCCSSSPTAGLRIWWRRAL